MDDNSHKWRIRPGAVRGPALPLAGTAGMAGLGLFYRALGEGALAVVAPVTAVTSAAIPVVGGLVPRGAGNGAAANQHRMRPGGCCRQLT